MQHYVKFLSEIPLFSNMPESTIERKIFHTSVKSYVKRGDVIYR